MEKYTNKLLQHNFNNNFDCLTGTHVQTILFCIVRGIARVCFHIPTQPPISLLLAFLYLIMAIDHHRNI